MDAENELDPLDAKLLYTAMLEAQMDDDDEAVAVLAELADDPDKLREILGDDEDEPAPEKKRLSPPKLKSLPKTRTKLAKPYEHPAAGPVHARVEVEDFLSDYLRGSDLTWQRAMAEIDKQGGPDKYVTGSGMVNTGKLEQLVRRLKEQYHFKSLRSDLKEEVASAERRYVSTLMQFGPNNMATDRAQFHYEDMKKKWKEETGKDWVKKKSMGSKGFNPSEAIRKVGDELKSCGLAMPGYGQIFITKRGSGQAWYVGGDGDEDGFSKLVKEKLDAVEGIDEVTYEAEGFPPRDGTWMQVYPKERDWGKKSLSYSAKDQTRGTCKQGERSDLTGCVPASGGGGEKPTREGQSDTKPEPTEKVASGGAETRTPGRTYSPPPEGQKLVKAPCCLHDTDPYEVDPETGQTKAARVGLPGMSTPPPPKEIPRLPNLTEKERAVESRFADAYLEDPDGMVDEYMKQQNEVTGTDKKGRPVYRLGDHPKFFNTDDCKMLSPDYAGSKDDLPGTLYARGAYNVAVHQTANAVAKRAFMKALDNLPKGQTVLVTAGGCGSGKSFALSQVGQTSKLADEAGAVWDAAGDQNSTENEWVLQECRKRGIKAVFTFVHADPIKTWADPAGGVVERAQNKGRMIANQIYAESYVIGARNFKAFMDRHIEDPDASFFVIKNSRGEAPLLLNEIPEEALNLNVDDVARSVKSVIDERKDKLPKGVVDGAMISSQVWGEKEEKSEKSMGGVENKGTGYVKSLRRKYLMKAADQLKKGQAFDYFGEVWVVVRVNRDGSVDARQPHMDQFGKEDLIGGKTFLKHELVKLKPVGSYWFPKPGYAKEEKGIVGKHLMKSADQTYRGWKIEPYEGTQVGYRPSTFRDRNFRDPKGSPDKIQVHHSRKASGYLVHYPDGGTKFCETLKKAKEYIDNYLGE